MYRFSGGWLLVVACGALLAVGGGCETKRPPDQGAPGGEVNWRVASAYATELPLLGSGARALADRLAAVSAGRIKLEITGPDPAAAVTVFDAVGNGTFDAGWSSADLWSDRMPALNFFAAVPFGPGPTELLAWIYDGGGWELWKDLYGRSGVVPIPCGILPPEGSGWFRQPITSPEQFRGMRIRFRGLGGQALQKLGASVHLLPVEEIFPALERGVLDAAKFSIPAIDEKLGFEKVTKHYYFPGWQRQASLLELIINRDRWEALSPADQRLMELACRANVAAMLTEGEVGQGLAVESLRQKGVKIHYWSDEVLTAFKGAYDEVAKELSARDPDFDRVNRSLQAFRERGAEWSRLSRLPKIFE